MHSHICHLNVSWGACIRTKRCAQMCPGMQAKPRPRDRLCILLARACCLPLRASHHINILNSSVPHMAWQAICFWIDNLFTVFLNKSIIHLFPWINEKILSFITLRTMSRWGTVLWQRWIQAVIPGHTTYSCSYYDPDSPTARFWKKTTSAWLIARVRILQLRK